MSVELKGPKYFRQSLKKVPLGTARTFKFLIFPLGAYYRRPEHLESLFKQAGLASVQYHLAKRYWQILSTTKPSSTP